MTDEAQFSSFQSFHLFFTQVISLDGIGEFLGFFCIVEILASSIETMQKNTIEWAFGWF